jgi:hypothetical protein
MLKRREAQAGGSALSQQPFDSGAWSKPYPMVVEFLTQQLWEDGSARETGTLSISAEDSVWKGCLRDRAQGVFCFLSGKTPGALLEALEKGLTNDSLPWRVDKPWEGKKTKK